MNLSALLSGVEYELIQGSLKVGVTSIEYSGNTVSEGSVFVAIEGFTSDGHNYIDQSISNGASTIVLMNRNKLGVLIEGITYLLVKDTRKVLAILSINFYKNPSKKLEVFGITGTNGKTSVTYFLKGILNQYGAKVGIIGTIQNEVNGIPYKTELTTPESREIQYLMNKMYEDGCEFCVMEASSHALYLKRLFGIDFKVAIYTNLTQDHLDFHGSLEKYRSAKGIIFESLASDGLGVFNIDDNNAEYFINKNMGKTIKYGIDQECDFRAVSIKEELLGTEYTLMYNNKEYSVKLAQIGRFSVYNSLGSIAAAVSFGIPIGIAIEGIKNVKVKGRFELVDGAKDFAVVVDYAHTPDGLVNVLKSARKISKNNVICVFGCGGDRDIKKRKLMGEAAVNLSDITVVTSDNPRTEDPDLIIDMIVSGIDGNNKKFYRITNRELGIKKAIELAMPGDIVIIAGKGHEDYQIIGREKIKYSDFEIAKKYLKIK